MCLVTSFNKIINKKFSISLPNMSDNKRGTERFEFLTEHSILICILGLLILYEYYNRPVPEILTIADPKFSLLTPHDHLTSIPVNDTYNQLIDMKNFTFKINPKLCDEYPAGLLLMVLVSSRPTNFAHRITIRNTWGYQEHSTKVLFMVGDTNDKNTMEQLQSESAKYGDILQGNFVDAYRNMTYKHAMGLKWVTHHCPKAKYILKTDDDVIVNSRYLRHFLANEMSPWGARDLISCLVLWHAPVLRAANSKWKVTTEEFAGDYYPPYCLGYTILYSQDVVQRLLTAAQTRPYFWIDDVHLTGVCADIIKVPRTSLYSLFLRGHNVKEIVTTGSTPAAPFLFGPPDVNQENIKLVWKTLMK